MFIHTWVLLLMAWAKMSRGWKYGNDQLMNKLPELGPLCKAPLQIGFSTKHNEARLLHSINQFRNAYASGLTERHRSYLRSIYPPASSMRVVHRDAELSLMAQRIAQQCRSKETSDRFTYNPAGEVKLEVERFKNMVDAWHFVRGSYGPLPQDLFFAYAVHFNFNEMSFKPGPGNEETVYGRIVRGATMGNIDPDNNDSVGHQDYYVKGLVKMTQMLLDERIYVIGCGIMLESPHGDFLEHAVTNTHHPAYVSCVAAPRNPTTRRRSYTTGKGASRCPKGTAPSRKYIYLCDYPNRSSKSQLEIALIAVCLIMWRKMDTNHQ